ncbi:Peritrophin type-A domain protein 3 [Operophtera brumata]|uniref:Peritrophin type-A domain protein 3 n=1 Tax=Operophtera brumata TaxID=104452 RepID=A0A0L7L6Y7_OPEBR|nr:Peritrophin type-A domain protein 3 [Operophtera brumata]
MKRLLLLLRSFIIFLLCATNGHADEIDLEVQSGLMMKMLRVISKSVFCPNYSCENRTYGYYADVDNDCQIFHVCLPSHTTSGRNVTYKWSFICPNETIFNQEVIVCTRPADAIDCKDSPMYYDLNKELGKEPNKTRKVEDTYNTVEAIPIRETMKKEDVTPVKVFPSRNPIKRKPTKQNYIVQQLIKDIVDDEMREKLQNIDFTQDIEEVFPVVSDASGYEPNGIVNKDRIVLPDEKIDANEKVDFGKGEDASVNVDFDESDRLILERSMGRNFNRGLLRFSAHV